MPEGNRAFEATRRGELDAESVCSLRPSLRGRFQAAATIARGHPVDPRRETPVSKAKSFIAMATAHHRKITGPR